MRFSKSTKTYIKIFNKISSQIREVFIDWVEIMFQQDEKQLATTLQKYNNEQFDLLLEASSMLKNHLLNPIYCDDNGGLLDIHYDILGLIFAELSLYDKKDQFFTPCHIAHAQAKMLKIQDGERVFDPFCGSGIMLMCAFHENKNAILIGRDIDLFAVKMCCVNLSILKAKAKIIWGNSLHDTFDEIMTPEKIAEAYKETYCTSYYKEATPIYMEPKQLKTTTTITQQSLF